MTLPHLPTKALLEGLTALLGTERHTLARLVEHLVEVEDRRAHLEAACSSLFDFCVRKLRLSEGEAFRRINAARLARRFPVILGMIEDGRIHLSALVLLRDHLTDENHARLLDEASGKSKREILELIARTFPRPDVRPSVRKLPALAAPQTSDTRPVTGGPAPVRPASVVEPLSSARYKIQLTGSVELKEKLERAVLLMRHRQPDGDLTVVVERALDLLLAKLENERLGKTSRPQRPRGAKPSSVTRSVRREVVDRDNEQCAFVSEDGERCPERAFLELDHKHPRALGGTGTAPNVRLLCRGHNRLEAERHFGREHIAEQIDLRRNKRNATESSVFGVATRALTNMGFRAAEAESAIRAVRARQETEKDVSSPPNAIEGILHAALRVLTDPRHLQISAQVSRASLAGGFIVDGYVAEMFGGLTKTSFGDGCAGIRSGSRGDGFAPRKIRCRQNPARARDCSARKTRGLAPRCDQSSTLVWIS